MATISYYDEFSKLMKTDPNKAKQIYEQGLVKIGNTSSQNVDNFKQSYSRALAENKPDNLTVKKITTDKYVQTPDGKSIKIGTDKAGGISRGKNNQDVTIQSVTSKTPQDVYNEAVKKLQTSGRADQLQKLEDIYSKKYSSSFQKENYVAPSGATYELRTRPDGKVEFTSATGGGVRVFNNTQEAKTTINEAAKKVAYQGQTKPEQYKASNGANYELRTRADGKVEFTSAKDGSVKVFPDRASAVTVIENVAKAIPFTPVKTAKETMPSTQEIGETSIGGRDYLEATTGRIKEIENYLLDGYKNRKDLYESRQIFDSAYGYDVKTPSEKEALDRAWLKYQSQDYAKGIDLTNQDQRKINIINEIQSKTLKANNDNLVKRKNLLAQSNKDLQNLYAQRGKEIENLAQEQRIANDNFVNQFRSEATGRLGGRYRQFSKIVGKDGKPIDDASMLALMGDEGYNTMQSIIDYKNKILEANNKITEKEKQDLFTLKEKGVLDDKSYNEAIYLAEYENELNNIKATSEFYNSLTSIVDTAKTTGETTKIGIQEAIIKTLSDAGFTAEEIGKAMSELGEIKDKTQVYTKLYALAKDKNSSIYQSYQASKDRASKAAETKFTQDLAIKGKNEGTSSSGIKPTATQLAYAGVGLSGVLSKLGANIQLDSKTVENNYTNILGALNSAFSSGQGTILKGEWLGLNKDIKIDDSSTAGKLLTSFSKGEPLGAGINVSIIESNTTPTQPENAKKINIPTVKSSQQSVMNFYNKNPSSNLKSFVQFPDNSAIVYYGDGTYKFYNKDGRVSEKTKIGTPVSKYVANTTTDNMLSDLRNIGDASGFQGKITYPAGGMIEFDGKGKWVYTDKIGKKTTGIVKK